MVKAAELADRAICSQRIWLWLGRLGGLHVLHVWSEVDILKAQNAKRNNGWLHLVPKSIGYAVFGGRWLLML